jgi:hypothetical protein
MVLVWFSRLLYRRLGQGEMSNSTEYLLFMRMISSHFSTLSSSNFFLVNFVKEIQLLLNYVYIFMIRSI